MSTTFNRGRPFVKGNAGRKPGSKNRNTLLAAEILEEDRPTLLRKAIELASEGDVQMLKFLLGRILPRERPLRFELPPLRFADDGVEALGTIARAVASGSITTSEGANLASIVQSFTAAIETNDVVKRLDALEAHIKAGEGR
jgi:hypothetical protein